MATELDAIKYGLQKTIYKKSLYDFVKDACVVLEPSTNWDFNWHVKYLCDVLQKQAMRIHQKQPRTNDFIINVPFRSMKSLIFSVLFPAWVWTFYPECKIMTVSYAETLAVKQSYLTKILINSEWYQNYFPEVKLMIGDNAKGAYTNIHGGTRQSFGMNGAITGSGADIIICDDPNKVKESRKQLQNTNTTYSEMVMNRLNDPEVGCRFIIQQRINQNDLSGYLLKKVPDEYQHICIPAEETKNIQPPELVEHYKDGLFWKSRFSRRILKQYKTTLGSRGYNGQLNQETLSDGGNILKKHWFKIVPYESKKYDKVVWDCFIDPAYTSKQTNDATGVVICKKIGNFLVVRYAVALRLEFPDLIKYLKQLHKDFKLQRLYIEGKASGLSILQQLRKETAINVMQLPNPKDDKETRVNSVSPIVESERVHLIDGSWNEQFIEECCQFPLGTNDDQLDALVYALNKWMLKGTFHYKM